MSTQTEDVGGGGVYIATKSVVTFARSTVQGNRATMVTPMPLFLPILFACASRIDVLTGRWWVVLLVRRYYHLDLHHSPGQHS